MARGLSTTLVATVLAVAAPGTPGERPADAAVVSNSGDARRTGWYPDQTSLTPSLVSGGTFGQLFSTSIVGQVYAQPLVVNGIVFVATEANWMYGIDAVTGAIRWSRNVGTPFNPQDVACGDLVPEIGITGTPAIDDVTGTAYMVAKSYVSGSGGATQWKMHAVDVATGAERPGFPVTIEGNAQNNPAQPFTPTTQHQRPGLLLMDGVVYAAFGGHCDAPPFRGWVAGVSTSGQLRALFSTRAGDATASGNGIWHSGHGLVSDRPGSIVFATGNAFGGGTPSSAIPGNQPPPDLGQSVVRLTVQPDGTLRATDFFTPFDAPTMDETDADLGSGGPVSLPPQYFGTPSIPNLILEIGKQGYLYVLDADNLGGSRQGPGQGDLVVNRLGPFGGVWGRPGVWPGDGGYIYIPYNQGTMGVYRYGLDGNGRPTFSAAGSTADVFGYGSSAPVITSSGAASGSALVWVIWSPNGGANAQLRAYDPVPVNGVLPLRFSASVGAATKFTPPGVGNNRVYVGTADGRLLAYGAPVNPPVTAPAVSFPPTIIGQSSTATATITATGTVTVSAIGRTGAAFAVGAPSRPLPATLTAGQTITVPVSFTPTVTGTIAGTLDVTTGGGQVKVPLSGSALAALGLLEASPVLLSFGGAPVGGQLTGTVQFANVGGTPVTIQGVTLPGAPFAASGTPAIGSTIAPGAAVVVNVSFAPTAVGQFVDEIVVTSDRGTAEVPLSGSAALPGVLSVTPLEIDYGTVAVGATRTQTVTVRNTGGSTLTITKSKPPSSSSFRALTGLAEGTTIPAGQSVRLDVSFAPQVTGPLSDTWILNADQPGSTLQTVNFSGVGEPATGVVIPDPTAGGWRLNGSASLLGTTTGSLLQLTPAAPVVAGSAFWPTSVAPTTMTAAFDLTIGGGTGADGLTFVLADPAQGATPTSIGGPGGGLGVASIPGLAVAFATYPEARVGITRTGTGTFPDWIDSTTAVPALRGTTRHVGVSVAAGVMTVTIDGATVLSSPVTVPPNALVGFTAATGGFDDQHAVSNVIVSAVGVPATLSVAPSPLSFDDVVTGAQGTRTLTLSNTGGSPLTLGALTPPVAPFAVSGFPPAGTVVPAGQSVSGTVTFSPTATGSFTGSLAVASSAGAATVPLGGTGVPPLPGVLAVTPATVAFGDVSTLAAATATVTIANTGQSVLAVTGVTPPTGDFTVTGLPAVGTSIAPGQTVQATVRFAPQTVGAATASLTVASTAGTAAVSLGGRGVAPSPGVLSVTPVTLSFGTLATGASTTRTVTVANTGGSPLTIGAVTLPVAPFAVTGLPATGSTLAPGATVTATVTYAPTAGGVHAGTLTIDSSVGAASVALSGTGVVGVVIGDPTAGGWRLNGAASLLGTTPGSLLQLTPAAALVAGSAFWPTSISSADVTASFDLTITGGTGGADGATFLLADVARGATPTSLGGVGGGLGAAGIPGLAVTFVTYPSDLVGISLVTTGSFPNYLGTTAAVPPLRAGVRHVEVTTAGGTVTVRIDGATVLSRPATLPANVLAGFTAATGGFTQQHGVSNVRITATTPPPVLTASPASLSFGTVTVGSSLQRTVTVTNGGTSSLTVTGRTVPAAPFTVSGWPANNATIAAGASVTATVTYAPTTATASTGTLTLTTAAGSISVPISGTGATVPPGVLAVNPAAVDLGPATVGSSTTGTVTVANTGGTALTVIAVTPPSAPFTVTGLPAVGASLAPGASVTATVTFAPAAAGPATGALTLTTSVGSATVSLTGTGVAPPAVLSVTPTDVTFDPQLIGSTAARPVTIANTGGTPFTVSSVTGPDAPFAVTGAPAAGTTVAPGDSVTLTVTFSPTAVGGAAGVLTVATSAGSATVTLAGTGVATPGVLTVTPLALDFGAVATGATVERTVSVANTGESALTLTAVTGPSAPFAVTGLPAAGAPLAPGASVLVTVRFAPVAAGPAADALSLASSGGDATVGLTGVGVAPPGALSAAPTTVAFGTVTTGTSATATVIVTNTGGSPVTIEGVTDPAVPFAVSGAPAAGSSVAPGASFSVTVTFSPTAAGPAGDTLTVTSSVGPLVVPLSGTGVAPPGVLTVAPTSLDFGSLTTGTSVSRTVTLSNTGSSTLTITSTSGPGAPYSAVGLPPAGTTLAPGATLDVTVTFAPTAAGVATGSLTVVSSVGTATVAFTGSGVTPPGLLTTTPSTVDLGAALVGTTVTRTVTLANGGAGPLTVGTVTAPVAPFTAAGLPVAGTVLAPGQTVTATVTYAPSAPGAAAGSFTVASSGGTVSVGLAGSGLASTVVPSPIAGGWQLNGSATLTGTTPTSFLRLTPANTNRVGSAFWPRVVSSTALVSSFDTSIGTGTGGHGLTFVLADPAAGARPTSLGSAGAGLGYVGIPAVAVGITTTPTNAIGIATGGTALGPTWAAQSTTVPSFRTGTHRVRVVVDGGVLSVSVDGVAVLSRAVTLPPRVLLGFTAATGTLTDRHQVGNVSITAAAAPEPFLVVDPSSVAFGTVTVGSSVSRNVVVANLGSGPATVTSTAAPSAPFTVTGLPAAGTVLAAGSSSTVTVTFTPIAAGAAGSTVGLATDGGAVSVPLSGTGALPPAVLSVTPTTIAFGVVPRNTTASRTVTIANTGGSPLTITAVGTLSAPYSLSGAPAPGTVLGPGQSVVLTVSFRPTVTATRRATLTITTSAGNASVSLSGAGS